MSTLNVPRIMQRVRGLSFLSYKSIKQKPISSRKIILKQYPCLTQQYVLPYLYRISDFSQLPKSLIAGRAGGFVVSILLKEWRNR